MGHAVSRRLLGALLGLFAVQPGCEDRPRPWEGKPGPPAVLTAPPSPPPAPTESGSGNGGGSGNGNRNGNGNGNGSGNGSGNGNGSGGGSGSGDSGAEQGPVRVGGPWVRCYGNFSLSGEPLKDLTRVSLLCGPSNGMRRLSKEALEGQVAEGAAPVNAPLPLVRGECYRVFAAAERGVLDLDVVVRSSRGVVIASDGGEDGWPIVQPDRPFCALDDDQATLEISARKGSGKFAAEVWVLRTPPPRP